MPDFEFTDPVTPTHASPLPRLTHGDEALQQIQQRLPVDRRGEPAWAAAVEALHAACRSGLADDQASARERLVEALRAEGWIEAG